MTDYPSDTRSLVIVTFIDGEVKTYPTSAGLGITRYMAKNLADTGALAIWTKTTSHTVLAHQIRDYELVPYEPEPEPRRSFLGAFKREVNP